MPDDQEGAEWANWEPWFGRVRLLGEKAEKALGLDREGRASGGVGEDLELPGQPLECLLRWNGIGLGQGGVEVGLRFGGV